MPIGSGSVDSHIFADPDPRNQNVADPTDPDPNHWEKLSEAKWKKNVSVAKWKEKVSEANWKEKVTKPKWKEKVTKAKWKEKVSEANWKA